MDLTERLIQSYYYGTLPYRKWSRRRAERDGIAPISMLFYHRVDDDYPNPWSMPCDEFQRQIDWLQDHYEIISLSEAQNRIIDGRNEQLAACITFDDGYADNCEFALPLLLERGIPFTYFVSLDFVVNQKPFPHDVKRGEPLAPNTVHDIQYLADQGVDIGAHTRTHPNLGEIHDERRLFDEVIGSRNELADLIGVEVPYFAFPFGQYSDLNSRAFSLAQEHGIRGVCSAYGGYNYMNDDGFHLQRVHADPMFWRTVNWMSIDPRIHRVNRFTPSPDYAVSEGNSIQEVGA